jgi:hypothetical protein
MGWEADCRLTQPIEWTAKAPPLIGHSVMPRDGQGGSRKGAVNASD